MSKIKKILYMIIFISIIFIYTNIVKAVTVEVTTETLNLRKEPSTDSDIVALISIGDECEVLGEEGDWYQVKYEDYTGYISKEYTKVVGENAESTETTENNTNTTTETETTEPTENNTEPEEPGNSSENSSGNSAKLKRRTNLKITPLINSSNIATLKSNEEVTIINQINGWTFIQNDEVSGWLRTSSLEISEGSSNNQNTTDNKNSNDEKNSTDNDSKDSENTENNEKSSSNFTAKNMYTIDLVNIRKEPNTNSNILMVVEQNTELKVVGESGDWYEVETSQGNAYVSKELLSNSKVLITNRGSVDRTKKESVKEEEKTSTSNSSENKNDTDTSSSSTAKAKEIVSYAKKFLGVPYVYGGASPSGFDCSGFTMYVYQNFGISMRHGAQAQAKLGQKVTADKSSKTSLLNNLEVGDLVFFLDYETMDEIGHCGIYIGDGDFIHASSGSGYCVKINSLLPGEYYNTRYCAARRII